MSIQMKSAHVHPTVVPDEPDEPQKAADGGEEDRTLQFLTADDHDDHDDVMATAEFAAETVVTVDSETFVVSMGRSVYDAIGGEAIWSGLHEEFDN